MATEDILFDMSGALGRLEGKLDGVLAEQERIARYAATTSERVGRIERSVANMFGWASGVAAAVAFVISIVGKLLPLGRG
jgi:hypothetical protein